MKGPSQIKCNNHIRPVKLHNTVGNGPFVIRSIPSYSYARLLTCYRVYIHTPSESETFIEACKSACATASTLKGPQGLLCATEAKSKLNYAGCGVVTKSISMERPGCQRCNAYRLYFQHKTIPSLASFTFLTASMQLSIGLFRSIS